MIIEYLYFYNIYHKKWIKGPFTQEQITRYASSCAHSVTKGLRNQMNLDCDTGILLSNSNIHIHSINVPRGMRNFCNRVNEIDENWFYFYWHSAGHAHKDNCKPRYDYFRELCLKLWFVEKLPTFEQYGKWSDTWDETYNSSFKKELLRPRMRQDSQGDLKYHRQFRWINPDYRIPKIIKTYKLPKLQTKIS